jgi:hypothetical protein
MISPQLPIVESKARSREIAAAGPSILSNSIQRVYSFHIVVPVVQRIEQGFPNSKDPVRQCFTKQICSYLESSFVLLNPPIFFD